MTSQTSITIVRRQERLAYFCMGVLTWPILVCTIMLAGMAGWI